MRRLLMIAYHFPPVGGVGTERSLLHATYLPEHGWQPVVVAPGNAAYRILVTESVSRIPEAAEVHRAPIIEPAHLRRVARRLLRRGPGVAGGPVGEPNGRAAGGAGPLDTLRRGANAAWAWIIPRLFFPDEQLLWIPSVVVVGELAHRRAPVEAVYSSGPPVSGHLAAAILAHRLGLPWIADFRDPWIGNAFAPRLPPFQQAAQRRLERAIMRRSSRVLFAGATLRDRYAMRYPRQLDRFVHLPNGYDRTELAAAPRPPRADGPFRLIYAGSVYGDRELDLFLDGLALALRRKPGLRDRLRVDFVGMLNAANRAIADERGAEFAAVVRFLGMRSRAEAIEMQRSANAGLVLIADGPGRDAVVTAKLYEYLGLDLPVLAVAPAGEARQILEELDWGLSVDPTPEGIADGLLRLVDAPRPDRRADPEGRYERRALTAHLAQLLDEVVV